MPAYKEGVERKELLSLEALQYNGIQAGFTAGFNSIDRPNKISQIFFFFQSVFDFSFILFYFSRDYAFKWESHEYGVAWTSPVKRFESLSYPIVRN